MSMAALTSAGGYISLLEEEEVELQQLSLSTLNQVIDVYWTEVAEAIPILLSLYRNPDFPYRQLAALVASKAYYHLERYKESLHYAINSGDYFYQEDPNGEYVKRIFATGIDEYISNCHEDKEEGPSEADKTMNFKLTSMVERLLEQCILDNENKQAIGIALECGRLDVVESAVKRGDAYELLPYVLETSVKTMQKLEMRDKVLYMLVRLYLGLEQPDYLSVSRCYIYLNDVVECSRMLKMLLTEEQTVLAFQIAFELENNASQSFLQQLQLQLGELTEEDGHTKAYHQLKSILTGEQSIKFYLEFLVRNNNSDLLILKNTKNALEARNSAFHSAITFANAFMHAGTTSDVFLRQNMDWLSRASNWSKFTATAALGVIHKGHLSHGMTLLQQYLPQDGTSGSPYSEGGALYALGIIYASHGGEIMKFLRDSLQAAVDENIQHGACLGIGVAGMASRSTELYEELKGVLYTDNAVSGEAAGLAMGLVLLGSGARDQIKEMVQYAHDTKHEKIIRALALGIALIVYGLQDEAEAAIGLLTEDKDPLLRHGGMYAIGLAYASTGSNRAIKKLLHVAVSDVSNDVRRAAVTALGFVLLNTPAQMPRVVQLLAESYNPHVRYGAAMALGIACAGSGMGEAIELLEPLAKDSADFVRQAAFIGLAMVLMQHNEEMCSKVTVVRKNFERVITNKHEDLLAKFGAVLAQGIIDAGGRNVTLSCVSRLGQPRMEAVVGIAMFSQFWFWFPLAHLLSLALTPTAIIGVNQHLQVPKMEFSSTVSLTKFGYPPKLKTPTTSVVEKVTTAVLSTTAKAKARAKKSSAEKDKNAGTTTKGKQAADEASDAEPQMDTDEQRQAFGASATANRTVHNMSRVLPQQLPYLRLPEDARYHPIKKLSVSGGIVMMVDRRPGEPAELIFASEESVENGTESTEMEAEPPQPFEYPFGDK